jgi:hypothetical protein
VIVPAVSMMSSCRAGPASTRDPVHHPPSVVGAALVDDRELGV